MECQLLTQRFLRRGLHNSIKMLEPLTCSLHLGLIEANQLMQVSYGMQGSGTKSSITSRNCVFVIYGDHLV